MSIHSNHARKDETGNTLLPVFTAVVWLVCTAGGVAGLRLQYQQSAARAKQFPPVTVEHMDVRMIGSPANAAAKSDATSPPAQITPQLASPPPMPAQIAMPEPLALKPAPAPRTATPAVSTQSPPVQHLVFGTGEGDKPPPDYPSEARIAHQQGTVVVRFSVDENGHVIDAQAAVPCPYPLLNQAAVRAVRDTWSFPSGKPRTFDVSFQFELHQK
jgi:protein TonB